MFLGTRCFEQEGFNRNQILSASTAESRDGDGSGDDFKELRTDMDGSETPT